MRPRSVAVIGASRSPGLIGNQLVANLIEHGFTGPVFPINPHAHAIHSIRAYPTIADVPDSVDLAVIAVPAERVAAMAEACGASGVRGLVVISAGFREIGGQGAERERELREIVARHGMRMVGPNCLGVLNTDPEFSFNATFAPVMPPPGEVAFLSQSGALGLSVLDYASEYGIGISQFVSVGNKPDVSGNDLLEYWEEDPRVSVILMYVESFGNPRRFREIATRVARKKPVLALKSGRSKAGAGAATSHTGALSANDLVVDALLHQAGVLRAQSIEELFDMAMAFGKQALPRSERTAIVTNSGGPGILAADALEQAGLTLAEVQPETIERLRPLLPGHAALRNPLDLIASAQPATYRAALEGMLRDPAVDAALAIFVPPLGVRQEDVAEAIVGAARAFPEKPVLAVLMGREGLPQGRAGLQDADIPAYIFPESAARALAALNRYRAWLQETPMPATVLAVDPARADSVLRCAQGEGRRKLTELEALELVAGYGIAVVPSRITSTAEEAVAAARELGFPTVMKVSSAAITHKTEHGGVILHITDEAAVRSAHASLREAMHAVGDAGGKVLVQREAVRGTELIAGISRDAAFGPIVMFGLGGVLVEVLRDVIFRLAPIDAHEAARMLSGIRAARILDGVRGQPPADRAALVDVLLRLSQLAVDFPQIVELDLNPLIAYQHGALALDARVALVEQTTA